MKLWDFYKLWECVHGELEATELKTNTKYKIPYIPREVWNKEVIAFYFENNKLTTKVN